MKSRLALVAALCISVAVSVSAGWVVTLPSPTGFGVDLSACGKVSLHWNPVGSASGYRVSIVQGGAVSYATTSGTSLVVDWLSPASYSFSVQALGLSGVTMDSGFTTPISANLKGCFVCAPPTITLGSVNPTVVWPPNGQMVPVNVAGSVDTQCPILNSGLVLDDEYGSSQVMPLSLGSSGGPFSGSLVVQASRRGNDMDGRVYHVSAYAENASGRGTSGSVAIVVPHDQR